WIAWVDAVRHVKDLRNTVNHAGLNSEGKRMSDQETKVSDSPKAAKGGVSDFAEHVTQAIETALSLHEKSSPPDIDADDLPR
ncbi:MAG: hypothetical protein EA402_00350, partial [Planctomycetota bacterium]